MDRCGRGDQWCHVCTKWDCCDNDNPAKPKPSPAKTCETCDDDGGQGISSTCHVCQDFDHWHIEEEAPPDDGVGSDGAYRRLRATFERHAEWSDATFGDCTKRNHLGPLEHLKDEADEAAANPGDVEEFADCLMLTLDAARRAGHPLDALLSAYAAKLDKNMERKWDVDASKPNGAVYHVKPLPSAAARVIEAANAMLPFINERGGMRGHMHRFPEVWDSDNGDRANKPCERCIATRKFRQALADYTAVRALSQPTAKEGQSK
ncbi:MAG: DUF550 domain-containing protein [Proteobacteria bacterium]|nr:DUF550 domain-containing protein [Pseudomonadota bacterium]